MVEVVTDVDGFVALEHVWRRLETGSHMRIFQTYLWCKLAWDYVLSRMSGNILCIIKWERGDDAVILPTYVDQRGTLRFIADDDSDVCDAVYSTGSNHSLAYKEIAKAIQENHLVKSVWLQKLCGDGEAVNYLGVLVPGAIVAKDNAFSWLHVKQSGDFIAAQTHMQSKDRADLKGVLRHSQKYELRVLSDLNGDAFPRNDISFLRAAMRKEGKRSAHYFDDAQLAFAEEIYRHRGCDVALLLEEGRLVAANILLKKDTRVLSWIFLYTDARASTSLYIKYLCELRCDVDYIFDFGVGVYSYKIGTFRPNTKVTYSLRYGKSHMSYLFALARANVRFLKDYVKAALQK